ncbi:hypothetical protein [Halegenticoccus tardaugens]|uniref:hypothetical protein n=1 Tax=Halegenticoccus tardaugens TaxID=2071624 RepID=UPI00100B11F8|nr:hypothetical protein [Halegenticoccus tardaugens]
MPNDCTDGGIEVDEAVLTELREHETQHGPHMIRVLERHHPEYHPGIPLELLNAYAERLGYDVALSDRDIERKTVDDESWREGDVYYRIGGNVSAYPPTWHERFDEGDLRALVEVMLEETGRTELRRDEVLLAAESIAGMDRRSSESLLTEYRESGRLEVEPYQNPEALVYLPEPG